MVMYFSSGGRGYRKPVMIFIDGAYLREEFSRVRGHLNIDFQKLQSFLAGLVDGEMIRTFYYDAVEDLANSQLNEEYLNRIKSCNFYQIRLGRVKKKITGKKEQKGVDVLLAIDMITKAYEGQYEIAIILTGDEDFLDVVNAVKETGKRVYGVFCPTSVSKDLRDSFDARHILSDDKFDSFAIK